jgi:DNA polymerase I-like protein with 3'-5' exonuclease and polymerase domains
MQERITSSYLHQLQAVYHRIDHRGICIFPSRIAFAKRLVDEQIAKNLAIASKQWNCHVFIGAANDNGSDDSVNLNATQGEKALLKKLQSIGYVVPKITKKSNEGEYESKYSTGELALQKMLVTNHFKFAGGDPAIRAILKVRELGKLKSSYLSARLYQSPDGNSYYLSNYNCAGTLTGRRSSRKHTFGFGNNGQNFPKHGDLSAIFRRCLVARPGNIFLMVDQKSAEEWPVSALAENHSAINEMLRGVNRHIKRASSLFNIPESSRTDSEWKDSIEYYLGKKVGHANNYGMRGQRMSDSLAQEGHLINKDQCQALLDKMNLIEPNVDKVFHKYVQEEVYKTRILRTPAGRERQFLGLRPNDSNYSILNEAYSYIPQSTVGDNTGFGVYYLEISQPVEARRIVQEGHDSIVQDIYDDADEIWKYLQRTMDAFKRRFKFHNGIEVEIPIEAEIGYDFKTTVKLKDLSFDNVQEALAKIRLKKEEELDKEKTENEALASTIA